MKEMPTYVLVVILALAGGGKQIEMQDFTAEEACENAKIAIRNQFAPSELKFIACLWRGPTVRQ